MKSNFIGHGFVAPQKILEEEYIFGAQKLPDTILNDKGDWRKYLPLGEHQHSRSSYFDTYGCTIYNTLQIIEILKRFLSNSRIDYSERFVYIGTETRPPGNNPHIIAEWIRHNGLVREIVLPFNEDILTLSQYSSPHPLTDNYLKEAKKWLANKDFKHEWVFKEGDKKYKADILKEALRRSPIGVSVVGWQERNGIYYKEEGQQDNHWTDLVAYEGDNPIIYDSYEPFLKKLESHYNFGFAKRYFLGKKSFLRNYFNCIFS